MNSTTEHSIAILGSGESAMGAALLARTKGHHVFLSESGSIAEHKKKILSEQGIVFEQGGHTIGRLLQVDEVVKSPGIPEHMPVIQSLRAAKKPIISEIEYASRCTRARLIGITGSNGKTTTALLTCHLLKSAGLDVGLAGNIGNSLSELLLERDYDIIVLELSSFQLDGVYKLQADTAMLLNITPDHLDRYHNDLNEYADSKLRIIQNQTSSNQLIYNMDDKLVCSKLASRATTVDKIGFSLQSNLRIGACRANNTLLFNTGSESFSITTGDIPIIGKHNVYNTMAAVLAAIHYGVAKEQLLSGLKSFQNAAHRLEYVAEVDGVRFINDSKATNVNAVYYALEAVDRDIIWITGGVNKGNDYAAIKQLVRQKVRALICLGKDNEHLRAALADEVEAMAETQDMDTCVKQSLKMAYPGDAVLLSPACASFDLFSSYEERGDAFKRAVADLKNLRSRKELVL